MNQDSSPQTALFRMIRERLAPNLSLVHEISELLDISYDSAYRRIRCEKELNVEELRRLCYQYSISIDSLFNLTGANTVFQSRAIGQDGFTFYEYLRQLMGEIKVIHDARERYIIYSAKDIPLFHFFQFPEIAAFKVYFWHKALFPSHDVNNKLFVPEIVGELFDAGRFMMSTYSKIPTVELWNEETITSILRQIDYCFISGFFADRDDAFHLCDVLETWVRHVQHQAEHGFRFPYGADPVGIEDSYKLYYNEVLLSDNTILVEMDGKKTTYLTYNIINLLITDNPDFCDQIENSLRIVMQKSTLISGTSAKERNRFFNVLVDKIRKLKESMESVS